MKSSNLLVTTYLEMRSPDRVRAKRCADSRFQIREKTDRDWRFNRDLYFRVGEQWHWIDKRPWTDAQWKEYAAAPELRTFAAYYDDALAGYYELRCESELATGRVRPIGGPDGPGCGGRDRVLRFVT